jgi:hypothetical protein
MCSFVFCCLVYFFYYFVLYISIWYRFFFSGMPYILFIGFMRLSTHLVLRILSNPGIYIVVLLYKSLSNPNISIGLYRCYFNLLIFAVKVSPTFYSDFMTYHRHFTAKKHRPRWFLAKTRCACCIPLYCPYWNVGKIF